MHGAEAALAVHPLEPRELDWHAEEWSSLDSLTPAVAEQLARVARDPFHTPAWLRMLARIDLSGAVRGEVRLSFVVVRHGPSIVAFCPLLDVRAPSVYHYYNLEKSYFTQALHQVRLDDDSTLLAFIQGAMTGWLRALRLLRVSLWPALIVVAPLAYRSDVLVLAEDSAVAATARQVLVSYLRERAASEGRPLIFLGVDEDNEPLAEALDQAGLLRLFFLFDNKLQIVGENFDAFVGSLPPTTRRRYRAEIRAGHRGGLRFATEPLSAAPAERLSELYEATYQRYGDDHFHHGPDFFDALQSLGPTTARICTARDSDALVSYSLLIRHGSELWNLRVGTDYALAGDRPAFFNAFFYEPVRYALQQRCSACWLGPGSFRAKYHRGARLHPIYMYVDLPGLRNRYLVSPYMRGFSWASRRVQERMVVPSAG